MITLDELDQIFAANCLSDRREDWRAGLVAVVRALEPVIANAWFDGERHYGRSREAKSTTERMAKLYAECLIQKILGDAPTGDAGVDDVASNKSADASLQKSPANLCEDCPPIGYSTNKTRCETCPRLVTPASFCEWRLSDERGEFGFRWLKGPAQCGNSPNHEGYAKMWGNKCICGKPIKFMADASTRKDEGLSGSSVQPPTPAQVARSAATLSGRDVMVRHWHLRNNHAPRDGHIYCDGCEYEIDDLIEALNNAGYKILPRETTLEMIGAARDCADCLGDIWRAMWSAAK